MSMNTRETKTEDVHFRVIAPLPTPVPNLHRPALDIAVPVHNQAQELARAVRRLRSFLRMAFPFSARITIADCASTDSTRDVATALAAELVGVRLIHLNEVGRGRPRHRRVGPAAADRAGDLRSQRDLGWRPLQGAARRRGSPSHPDRAQPHVVLRHRASAACQESRHANSRRLKPAPGPFYANSFDGGPAPD